MTDRRTRRAARASRADDGGVPWELRSPHGWQAFADPADLHPDPVLYRARAQRRQTQALAEWAESVGVTWREACRRAG